MFKENPDPIKPCSLECVEEIGFEHKTYASAGFFAYLRDALSAASESPGHVGNCKCYDGVNCTVRRNERHGYFDISFVPEDTRENTRFLLPVSFGANLWAMENTDDPKLVLAAGACTHSLDKMRDELVRRYPGFMHALGQLTAADLTFSPPQPGMTALAGHAYT